MSMIEAQAAARELLANAAERSKRGNVAYAPEFIRTMNRVPNQPISTPPLARLIQGGRGGEVRLKLYLLLTMMATQSPFDIRNPPTPRTLARTLALPPTGGPRRINDNLRWLEDHHFIERTKRPGQTAAIQLLDPQGTARPVPKSAPYPALGDDADRVLVLRLAAGSVSDWYRRAVRPHRTARRTQGPHVSDSAPTRKLRPLPRHLDPRTTGARRTGPADGQPGTAR